MAKNPNYNGKAEKRMKNNYFTQQIQRNPNFLEQPRFELKNSDCIRIFRELIMGRININDHIGYLTDPKILIRLISVSYDRYIETEAIAKALSAYVMYNYNMDTTYPNCQISEEGIYYVNLQKKYADMCTVYAMINTAFNQVLNSPNAVVNTVNNQVCVTPTTSEGIIISLVSNLNKYISIIDSLY